MERQIQLNPRRIGTFRKRVYDHYKNQGRDLPWRRTTDPYEILVSEIMLQQTQVPRVLGKYEEFLREFPDVVSLARAPLRKVVAIWQGLGYNRRALALKRLAQIVVEEHEGRIPSSIEALMALPGVGGATAGAICAFAFDQPTVFIETNIRAVFIHHFFEGRSDVKDEEILPLVTTILDAENPRVWYYALMDYGAELKKRHVNPGRRSAHHLKQGTFKGSNRQIRGMILQIVLKHPRMAEDDLIEQLDFDVDAVRRNLQQLEREGLVAKDGRHLFIA